MNPREEIAHLTEVLERANHQYYVLDAPDDGGLSNMTGCCGGWRSWRPRIRSWPRRSRPTRRVGGEALSKFEKVEHAVPLESLQDVFSPDEVREFDAPGARERAGRRLQRRAEGRRPFRCAGICGRRVRPRRNARRRPHRRGRDGESQDDPLHSRCSWTARRARLIVRGEVFMPRAVFAQLNESARGGGQAAVCQSAQCRSGQPAPARSRRWRRSGGWTFSIFNLQLAEGRGVHVAHRDAGIPAGAALPCYPAHALHHGG